MVATDSQIKVYVRKGSNKGERTLAFIIPPNITQDELMEHGWGIDGNQAILYLVVGELAVRQIELMDWFRQKGHRILYC